MDNISELGRMVLPFRAWVTSEKAQQLASYAVRDGDILISRAGTVGKMCVVRTGEEKSLITTNLIRLRLGEGLLPDFLVALMTYFKGRIGRSEEHTSELQSLMRISYAVFCLKQKPKIC